MFVCLIKNKLFMIVNRRVNFEETWKNPMALRDKIAFKIQCSEVTHLENSPHCMYTVMSSELAFQS